MTTCDQCWRTETTIVVEDMMPAMPSMGINEPWTFTYRLCRWHKAAWTRWLKKMASYRKERISNDNY